MNEKDHARILNLARRAVVEDPYVSARDLYDRACERYPSVQSLSLRQFNARFLLQAKRERAIGKRQRKRETKAPIPSLPEGLERMGWQPPARGQTLQEPEEKPEQKSPAKEEAGPKHKRTRRPPWGRQKHRQAVRKVLFEFAADLANADTASDVVDVVGRLDGYVDRVLGG